MPASAPLAALGDGRQNHARSKAGQTEESVLIRIRFVTCDDPLSAVIRAQAGAAMPFTPSHAEALSPDGKFYLGQHFDGGMQRRPVGYDDNQVLILPPTAEYPQGLRCDRIVSIPCTPEQEAAFYGYLEDKVGMPYDWVSILGFALTEIHLHQVGHLFCSAIMTAALRTKGCEVLRWPVTTPFHKITPWHLMLMLSVLVEVPH